MNASPETKSDGAGSGSGRFERTQWTMILKAREEGAADAQEAMEAFARIYWPPLYRFIRREGYNRHDAQDLTQEFYHHFREKHLLDRVTERNGKFRTFLLTCLKNFLSDQRDRAGALKRGAGQTFIALDALEAEERDAIEPADGLTAEQIYEQRWARTLLNRAEDCLRNEYVTANQVALYEALQDALRGAKTEAGYAGIAARFGLSESAVKSSVRRLRARYQEILREEIGRTVCRREDIDEEIRYLISVLGR